MTIFAEKYLVIKYETERKREETRRQTEIFNNEIVPLQSGGRPHPPT